MQNYKKLRVWEHGHQVVLEVYRITASFPSHEMYGLTSQLRRASVSITSNIVEGCYRDGNKEFIRFLHISIASASELEYQLMLSHDLHYLDDSTYQKISAMVIEEKRMLSMLIYKAKNASAAVLKQP